MPGVAEGGMSLGRRCAPIRLRAWEDCQLSVSGLGDARRELVSNRATVLGAAVQISRASSVGFWLSDLAGISCDCATDGNAPIRSAAPMASFIVVVSFVHSPFLLGFAR